MMIKCLFVFTALLAGAIANNAKPAEVDLDDPIENFKDPVLNSSTASRGQFPWQLHLKRNGVFTCGAVLVGPNRALTAANCLSSGTYTATAGEHNTGTTSGNEVTLTVSSWTRHPSYSTGSGYPNDIAILRFNSTFIENNFRKPISMASTSSPDYAGTNCTISGWGRLSGGGNTSSALQYATMPVISNSNCLLRWSGIYGAKINDGHICVFQSGKSACSRDRGGPMVCNNTLAGIASWGTSSCSGGYPSVYSRVSYFRNWIESNLN